MKVFLGGTCNGSAWRDTLIPLLKIEYFNPVVPPETWMPSHVAEEIYQRAACDICLYVITPMMSGVYSIAEAVDDSNKRPAKTLFAYLPEDQGRVFEPHQLKSLKATADLIVGNCGTAATSLEEVAAILNSKL